MQITEGDVSDAETYRRDVGLHLHIYIKGAFVGVMNEQFNLCSESGYLKNHTS